MLFTRRALILSCSALTFTVGARSKDLDDIPSYFDVPKGKYFGDFGYFHDVNHEDYVQIFGKTLACACGTGECRVTKWRPSRLGSYIGYDIVVARQWFPITKDIKRPQPEQVPVGLKNYPAHVCAYGEDYNPRQITIACAIVPPTEI